MGTTKYAVVPNQGHYGPGAKIQPLYRSNDLLACIRQARRQFARVIERESDSDNEVLCLGNIADTIPDLVYAIEIGCIGTDGQYGYRAEGSPEIPQWAADKAERGDNDSPGDGKSRFYLRLAIG